MKKLFILINIIFAFFIIGCKSNNDNNQDAFNPLVKIIFEDNSEITLELSPSDAPETVNHFIELVKEDVYDGLEIDFIDRGNYIQGGNLTSVGKDDIDYTIYGEFLSNNVNNPNKFEKGTIGLFHNRGMNNSGKTSFFITLNRIKSLDSNYAAFGKVTEGLDVLDKISNKDIDDNYKPLDKITIKDMVYIPNGYESNNPIKIFTSPDQYLNDENPVATITMKDGKEIKLQLFPDIAPNTVNNFIKLASDGFYNDLIFHRVIENFMIQGGDPEGTGAGGPGYSIFGEFQGNGFNNTLSHRRGVISMARSNDPDSAGSQFFITRKDSIFLDGEYAAFGYVISGIEVIDEIASVPTNKDTSIEGQDKPLEDQVITSITIDTKGKTYLAPEIIKQKNSLT